MASSRMRRGAPSSDSSTAPARRILPSAPRPLPATPFAPSVSRAAGLTPPSRQGLRDPRSPAGGSGRGRPWHGAACAAAARRSCGFRCQAAPGAAARRCRWNAWPRDAPARNHVLSGRWLRCITVPAVTGVWRPHPAHPGGGARPRLPAFRAAAGRTREATAPAQPPPGARRRRRRPGSAPRTPGGTWAGRVCIAMP